MDIISYDKIDFDSMISRFIVAFDMNPKLTRYISELSYQYNTYKESYKKFPSKLKSTLLNILQDINLFV